MAPLPRFSDHTGGWDAAAGANANGLNWDGELSFFPSMLQWCTGGAVGLFNICDEISKQQARCETADWQNLLLTLLIYPPLGYWFEPLILLQTLADTP